jgi:2-isopropylmalate synthase
VTTETLIYDWNLTLGQKFPTVEICDETLRDGLQSPSVTDPSIEDKFKLLELMDSLGITIANIGLPGAGPRAYSDVLALAHHARKQNLKIKLNCAARTVIKDIEPISRAQQEAGIKIVAYCFLGTSPIRQLVENWSLDQLKATAETAISYAVKEGLEVAFVTEDTTRSHPDTLRPLFRHAIALGATRLVLCDTVGHATPDGILGLVNFTKEVIRESGTKVAIDWHGHNDRGLGVSNALFAAQYGCDRIHGTALGVGERVGNTAVDQLIVNLKLLGAYPHDLGGLMKYAQTAAKSCGVPLPYNYPVLGEDATRTATGVHAAAVIKALNLGDRHLADTIYSGVPAHWFGKEQIIEIGPMSGASNVRYWLAKNNITASDEEMVALLNFAKTKAQVLTQEDIDNFLSSTCRT